VELRTCATFDATGFNTSVPKPTYVNPTNYGDDIAERLAMALREAGHDAGTPYCEDWGWCVEFVVDDKAHWLGVGRRPPAAEFLGEAVQAPETVVPAWLCFVERRRSLRTCFAPAAEKRVTPGAASAVHAALSSVPGVSRLAWHHQGRFDAGDESQGAPTPS
jgi:hypothetical protein